MRHPSQACHHNLTLVGRLTRLKALQNACKMYIAHVDTLYYFTFIYIAHFCRYAEIHKERTRHARCLVICHRCPIRSLYTKPRMPRRVDFFSFLGLPDPLLASSPLPLSPPSLRSRLCNPAGKEISIRSLRDLWRAGPRRTSKVSLVRAPRRACAVSPAPPVLPRRAGLPL